MGECVGVAVGVRACVFILESCGILLRDTQKLESVDRGGGRRSGFSLLDIMAKEETPCTTSALGCTEGQNHGQVRTDSERAQGPVKNESDVEEKATAQYLDAVEVIEQGAHKRVVQEVR